MARNNTFVKRQRDLQKKQKTEDKKARRMKRREFAKSAGDSTVGDRIPGEPS